MPKNEILLKRICQLIAQAYAKTQDEVYQRVMELNSIDLTIDELQTPAPRVGESR